MPMSRDDHEALLGELLGAELDHTRRTEILQQLRADYSGVLTDFDDYTKKTEKLEKENTDLVKSNSMLFRQSGIAGNPDKEKEEETKQFSETVTLEELEKQAQ